MSKELHAKVKLVGHTYLFGEKVSLTRGQEIVVDLNKLNIADLEILGHHIRSASVVSNINADEFIEKAAALRSEVLEGKVENVLKLQEVKQPVVLDAEVELEDGTKTTVAEVQKPKKLDSREEFVLDRIINKPASVAMIAAKNIPDAVVPVLEFAIEKEKADKNRKSVLAVLQEELDKLKKEK